jgi:DNA excision repair protein ERCC-2
MIDPKIANIVSADIQKDSIIIFDECHNIDNVCIESLSMYINNRTLDQANQSIKKLENQLREENRENSDRLQETFVNLT